MRIWSLSRPHKMELGVFNHRLHGGKLCVPVGFLKTEVWLGLPSLAEDHTDGFGDGYGAGGCG